MPAPWQKSRRGKANKSSRPVKREITIPEVSSTTSFCRDEEKPPKFKKPGGQSNASVLSEQAAH
jgi:hypothetical protein